MELGTAATLFGYVTSAASYVSSSTSPKPADQYRYYDPLLTLFELAMIPLGENSEQHLIKLYYYEVITRCPDSYWERAKRTVSRVSGAHQRRKQTVELVNVAIRAVRWYDPNEDSDFGRSIRFLFEKAIEGLVVYRKTYSEDQGEKTDKALKYIDQARHFLTLKLNEGSDDVLGSKTEEVKKKLVEKIKEQKEDEDYYKLTGKRCDSRSLWVVKTGDKNIELLTSKVADLQTLNDLKKEKDDARNEMTVGAFNNAKNELEANLKLRQEEFIKTMKS